MAEKINYNDHTLDPTKDVLVPPAILVDLQKFVNMTKAKHTEFKYDQQVQWFNKKTHKPLSTSTKISDEKRNEEYYRNINVESTEKKGRVVFDELSLSAIKLQAAFEEIFRHNVNKGNSLLKEKPIEGNKKAPMDITPSKESEIDTQP